MTNHAYYNRKDGQLRLSRLTSTRLLIFIGFFIHGILSTASAGDCKTVCSGGSCTSECPSRVRTCSSLSASGSCDGRLSYFKWSLFFQCTQPIAKRDPLPLWRESRIIRVKGSNSAVCNPNSVGGNWRLRDVAHCSIPLQGGTATTR